MKAPPAPIGLNFYNTFFYIVWPMGPIRHGDLRSRHDNLGYKLCNKSYGFVFPFIRALCLDETKPAARIKSGKIVATLPLTHHKSLRL